MAKLTTLTYGTIDDVAAILDNTPMNEMELRAVLINLIRHINHIYRQLDKAEDKLATMRYRMNGVKEENRD